MRNKKPHQQGNGGGKKKGGNKNIELERGFNF